MKLNKSNMLLIAMFMLLALPLVFAGTASAGTVGSFPFCAS